MIKDVTIPARLCQCDVCSYGWVSIAERTPTHCQNRGCRSREWNGVKPRKEPEAKPQVVLPKPNRIRKVDEGDEF
jgi:hypothetical protein